MPAIVHVQLARACSVIADIGDETADAVVMGDVLASVWLSLPVVAVNTCVSLALPFVEPPLPLPAARGMKPNTFAAS